MDTYDPYHPEIEDISYGAGLRRKLGLPTKPYNPYDPSTHIDNQGRQGYDPYRPTPDTINGIDGPIARRVLSGQYTGEIGSNRLPPGVTSRAGLRRMLQQHQQESDQQEEVS